MSEFLDNIGLSYYSYCMMNYIENHYNTHQLLLKPSLETNQIKNQYVNNVGITYTAYYLLKYAYTCALKSNDFNMSLTLPNKIDNEYVDYNALIKITNNLINNLPTKYVDTTIYTFTFDDITLDNAIDNSSDDAYIIDLLTKLTSNNSEYISSISISSIKLGLLEPLSTIFNASISNNTKLNITQASGNSSEDVTFALTLSIVQTNGMSSSSTINVIVPQTEAEFYFNRATSSTSSYVTKNGSTYEESISKLNASIIYYIIQISYLKYSTDSGEVTKQLGAGAKIVLQITPHINNDTYTGNIVSLDMSCLNTDSSSVWKNVTHVIDSYTETYMPSTNTSSTTLSKIYTIQCDRCTLSYNSTKICTITSKYIPTKVSGSETINYNIIYNPIILFEFNTDDLNSGRLDYIITSGTSEPS